MTINRLCGAIIIRYFFSETYSVVIYTACIYIFISDITSRCYLTILIRCVRRGNMFYGLWAKCVVESLCGTYSVVMVWNIFYGHGVEHDPWYDSWSTFFGGGNYYVLSGMLDRGTYSMAIV